MGPSIIYNFYSGGRNCKLLRGMISTVCKSGDSPFCGLGVSGTPTAQTGPHPRGTKQYIDRGELVRAVLLTPPPGGLKHGYLGPPKKGCFSRCGRCFFAFFEILVSDPEKRVNSTGPPEGWGSCSPTSGLRGSPRDMTTQAATTHANKI